MPQPKAECCQTASRLLPARGLLEATCACCGAIHRGPPCMLRAVTWTTRRGSVCRLCLQHGKASLGQKTRRQRMRTESCFLFCQGPRKGPRHIRICNIILASEMSHLRAAAAPACLPQCLAFPSITLCSSLAARPECKETTKYFCSSVLSRDSGRVRH